MATNATRSRSLQDGDDVFRRFQQQALLDFADRLDQWQTRILEERARESKPAEGARRSLTLGDLVRRMRDPAELSRSSEAVKRRADLVWELARLCRDFIIREIWAWGDYLRRQRVSVDDMVALLRQRASQTAAATRDRKWRPGLSLITPDPFEQGDAIEQAGDFGEETLDNVEWIRSVWTMVVEESVDDFTSPAVVAKIFARVTAKSGIATLPRTLLQNRDRIDVFIQMVMRETGEKITRKDVALLAGYSSLRELQAYQRGDELGPGPLQNIARALSTDPPAVVRVLSMRRPKSAQRKAVR